jgi:tetratricopeptide (TPR) repeat protein
MHATINAVTEAAGQTVKEAALAARQAYIEMGPDGPDFGRIPTAILSPLLDAVDGVRLPAAAARDVGWLEFEAAESFLSAHPGGDWEPRFSPDVLKARAKDRWERIVADRGNAALERSQAMCAIGSLGVYLSMEIGTRDHVITHVQDDYMTPYQIPAAELLLRAFDRDKDPEQAKELYRQTLLLLLSKYSVDTKYLIGASVSSRLQEEGNDSSFDAIVGVSGKQYTCHYLRLAAGEPTITGNRSITIPPSMLQNEAFDTRKSHGTLRALLAIERAWGKGKRLPDFGPENMHCKKVTNGVSLVIRKLATQGKNIQTLSVDITEGTAALAKVEQWYNGLSPHYRPISQDKDAFETAVNTYETAMTRDKKLDAQEIFRLGSLLLELGGFPEESDCYERAEVVFERAARRAEAQKRQDLLIYIQAKIGAANASIYRSIQTNGELDDDQFFAYRKKLYDIGVAVQKGVQIEGESARNTFLPTIRALNGMLLINSDPDGGHLAISPTIRQQTSQGDLAGFDTLVLPLSAKGFRINNAGRLRFGELVGGRQDSGIVTFTPEDLAAKNWIDDVEILGAVLYEMERLLEDPDNFVPDEWVEYMRSSLVEATDISRRT